MADIIPIRPTATAEDRRRHRICTQYLTQQTTRAWDDLRAEVLTKPELQGHRLLQAVHLLLDAAKEAGAKLPVQVVQSVELVVKDCK